MNKGELIDAVAAAAATSKAQAETAVNAVFDAIEKGLKKEAKVAIVGFGTFEVRSRKARTGRNPRTGAIIQIRASKGVGFKAGKALKEAL